jgi:hypothetical protein
MDARPVEEILKEHREWLRCSQGARRADLSHRILTGIDLHGRNLRGVKFVGADLTGANLSGAVLIRADFTFARLRYARMDGAVLTEAKLNSATLAGADLRYAELNRCTARYADFRDAILASADFREADIRGSSLRQTFLNKAKFDGALVDRVKWPAPGMVLLAWWSRTSDDLTRALMVYDRANHPHPETFEQWVREGICPFAALCCDWERSANFYDIRDLWSEKLMKRRPRTALSLAKELIKTHCDLTPLEEGA